MASVITRTLALLFMGSLALMLASCRTAPLHNVEHSSVPAGKAYTDQDVKSAIQTAGAALGWRIDEHTPGILAGTLYLRSHVAVVEIPYSRSGYSIRYKGSTNLMYDGERIHGNYNDWVKRLDNTIQAHLASQ